MPSKQSLLQQLSQRLAKLKTVSEFTKSTSYILAYTHTDKEVIERYLRHSLPLIEQFIERVEVVSFQKICERSRFAEYQSLSSEFGLGEKFDVGSWGLASQELFRQRQFEKFLFTTANQLVICAEFPHQNELIAIIVGQLAVVFGGLKKSNLAVDLYEWYLGISRQDYQKRSVLSKRIANAPACLTGHAILSFSQCLLETQRMFEAEQVLLTGLEIFSDEFDEKSIVQQIQRTSIELPGLPENMEEISIAELRRVFELQQIGGAIQVLKFRRPKLALDVALEFLNISQHGMSELGEELRPENDHRSVASCKEQLAGQISMTLNSLDREIDTIEFVEAFVGLTQADFKSEQLLCEKLSNFRELTVPLDGGRFLLSAYATALRRTRSPEKAALLLSCWLAVPGETPLLERAIAGTKQFSEGYQSDHTIGLISSWIRATAEMGRKSEAERITIECLGDLEWLKIRNGELQGPITNLATGIFELLLRTHSSNHSLRIRTCRMAIDALRASLSNLNMDPGDRLEFQNLYFDLRHLIVQEGVNWISSSPVSQKERASRWKEFLNWEAELGQRSVIERCLGGLALPETRCEKENAKISRNSPEHRSQIPLLKRLAKGISSKELARYLLLNELLLRISFNNDGHLVWAAIASVDGQLCVKADHIGKKPCKAELELATAIHDARIELSRKTNDIKTASDWLFNLLKDELNRFVSLSTNCPQKTPNQWNDLLRHLESKGFSKLASQLRHSHVFFETIPEAPIALEVWKAQVKASCRFLVDCLSELSVDPAVPNIRDRATNELLIELSRHICLDALSSVLEESEYDLIIQADDILHSVPVSYLQVQGRRLYEIFNSIRCTTTIVVDQFLRELPEIIEPENFRCVIHSWIEDRARIARKKLEESLGEDIPNLRWGNESDGYQQLKYELSKPTSVAVVLGHGHPEMGGMIIKDGIWTASELLVEVDNHWTTEPAFPLDQVDLLFQISCTIGRLSPHGERDVFGFCIEAAIANVRSIIAAKWPICAVESPAFAAEMIKLFFTAKSSSTNTSVKARALRDAKIQFHRTRPGITGLNTAAAFELYGLG